MPRYEVRVWKWVEQEKTVTVEVAEGTDEADIQRTAMSDLANSTEGWNTTNQYIQGGVRAMMGARTPVGATTPVSEETAENAASE